MCSKTSLIVCSTMSRLPHRDSYCPHLWSSVDLRDDVHDAPCKPFAKFIRAYDFFQRPLERCWGPRPTSGQLPHVSISSLPHFPRLPRPRPSLVSRALKWEIGLRCGDDLFGENIGFQWRSFWYNSINHTSLSRV